MQDQNSTTRPDPRIIVALDCSDARQALALSQQLDPQRCRLKVGKELFTSAGPEVILQLQNSGFEVFYDAKYHDIPNTASKAVQAAAGLGIWMVNIHVSGGAAMMKACREVLREFSRPPLLIGVTVLTSLNAKDMEAVGLGADLSESQRTQEQVLRLAGLAKECGLDGVVCSAAETALLRRELGPSFVLVTPGIRPAGADRGDQQRVMTPAQAIANGSDYLVIGRPITQAEHPGEALRRIEAELNQLV